MSSHSRQTRDEGSRAMTGVVGAKAQGRLAIIV